MNVTTLPTLSPAPALLQVLWQLAISSSVIWVPKPLPPSPMSDPYWRCLFTLCPPLPRDLAIKSTPHPRQEVIMGLLSVTSDEKLSPFSSFLLGTHNVSKRQLRLAK